MPGYDTWINMLIGWMTGRWQVNAGSGRRKSDKREEGINGWLIGELGENWKRMGRNCEEMIGSWQKNYCNNGCKLKILMATF